MDIAFFDFDGTLVKQDSLWAFLKFYFRQKRFYFIIKTFCFLPFYVGCHLRILSASKAKEKLIILFFKGDSKHFFLQKSKQFSEAWIPANLKKSALECLNHHQEKGDKIVIVSASLESYLRPFFNSKNIEVIGTRLDLSTPSLSGKFLTPNCNGKEKAVRIQERFSLKNYEKSHAYGDSEGDAEMFALVDYPHFNLNYS